MQQMLPSIRSIAGNAYVFQQDSVPAHRVRVRRPSSFSVKLRNSLLQTYGPQIVLIFILQTIEYEVLLRIVFIRRQFETLPIWSSAWLTQCYEKDCRKVSLTMLSTNGGRDLGRVWRKKEDISNIAVITELELA